RVQPSGVMSYVWEYRAGSGRSAPTRRMKIARMGQVTPDEARESAKSLSKQGDPAALRTAEKRAETLRQLADLFLAEHAEAKRKGSTAAFYRDVLERLVLPELGNRKAEKVTTAELARLHSKMKDHPYQANRVLAVVGSLYSFAGKRHILPIGLN